MLRQIFVHGGWVFGLFVALAGANANAQWSLDNGQSFQASRAQWEGRMTRPPAGRSAAVITAENVFDDEPVAPPRAAAQRSTVAPSRSTANGYGRHAGYAPAYGSGYRRVAAEEYSVDPRSRAPVGDVEPIPAGEPLSPIDDYSGDYQSGPACHDCGSGGCNYCDDGWECRGGCCPGLGVGAAGYVLRNSSLFAGVHGFKGPVDMGRNGNFGLHAGVNMGAAVGSGFDIGYQLGFMAVQSNFSGDQLSRSGREDRDQFFFTGGLFKRSPCGGLQWGVVFDIQHDRYYSRLDLQQIRQETSLVFPNGNEIGYMGIYGLDGDTYWASAENAIWFDPTDMYAVFLRRQFELGGEGRIWGGISGWGDGVFGADLRVPLGNSWAIENRINYLIPKEGHGVNAQRQESWGVAIQLVWYPGRHAACESQNCYRPLLSVADNSTFMVTSRGSR